MEGLVNGIYKVCDALVPVVGAVLVLTLVVLGLMTIINGAEGRVRFKEQVIYILIGSGIAFCAVALGKEIASWFM